VSDLKADIKQILDKHERDRVQKWRVPPSERFGEEYKEQYEKDRLESEREFGLMTVYLPSVEDTIDEESAKELKQNIEQKLAIRSLEKIGDNDWWWKSPSGTEAETLRKINRAVEKFLGEQEGPKFGKLRWAWWVFVEVVYLAIVVALFAETSSKFETAVIAALVLIYNQIAGVGIGFGMIITNLIQAAELIRWEFGQTLNLKLPFAPVTEAREAIRKTTGRNFLRMFSLGIGSLIALWHLVIALLD
jgi:hypothetical protein